MTLEDYIEEIRLRIKDTQEPYFFSDELIAKIIETSLFNLCKEIPIIIDTSSFICNISIQSNTNSVILSDRIIKILGAVFLDSNSKIYNAQIIPFSDMMLYNPKFLFDGKKGIPNTIVLPNFNNTYIIYPIPEEDYTLKLSVQRGTMYDLSSDSPELSSYQIEIPDDILRNVAIHNILYMLYSIDDSETYSVERATLELRYYESELDKLKRKYVKNNQIDRIIYYPSGIL
jgi:hypothetical protein